jgi:hypothetical protein
MRFNLETIGNQRIRQAHEVSLPAQGPRKVEAALAASTFTDGKRDCQGSIERNYQRRSFVSNLPTEVSSRSVKIDQLYFEIMKFKNQMTYFIFHLRRIYFLRPIKEA